MTKKTLKIDISVHGKLHKLLIRYKAKTYSDLIDSFCDYFEVSNIKPSDFDVSQKSPNVLFTDGISRIISFIRKSESTYLKDILKYNEKIVVQSNQILEKLSEFDTLETPLIEQPDDFSTPNFEQEFNPVVTEKNNNNLEIELEKLSFKHDHQTKFINEFFTKFSKSKFGNTYTISSEDLNHYKNEFSKLRHDN